MSAQGLRLLKTLGKAAYTTGRGVAKIASQGASSRMLLGAAIGGAYGIASSDKEDYSQRFMSGVRGAALGAGAVGAFNAAAKIGMAGFKNPSKAMGFGKLVAKAGGQVGGSLALTAVEHPFLTAGALGGAAYLASDTTPYYSSINDTKFDMRSTEAQEQQMPSELDGTFGSTPVTSGAQLRNVNKMQHSTYGLVQGLYNRRH